jgi:hypothetical protein
MQQRFRIALDLLFGIGFKIGFLIAVVGLSMMYMPMIQIAFNPLLEYVGFWDAFRANPVWLRVFITGLVLMGAAIVISVVKGWVEEMVDVLFSKDESACGKR